LKLGDSIAENAKETADESLRQVVLEKFRTLNLEKRISHLAYNAVDGAPDVRIIIKVKDLRAVLCDIHGNTVVSQYAEFIVVIDVNSIRNNMTITA
jgi:hypothetical protein